MSRRTRVVLCGGIIGGYVGYTAVGEPFSLWKVLCGFLVMVAYIHNLYYISED